MLNEYPFNLLEKMNVDKPGDKAKMIILDNASRRNIPLSMLETKERMCAWCAVDKVVKPRKKYCSDDCKNSAFFYFYPQNPSTKLWILINRQSCACAECGQSYEEEIKAKIIEKWDKQHTKPSWGGSKWKPDDSPITYYQVGYGTGEKWHIDHIKPLFLGGSGLGIDNIQVLCVPCHHKKTAEERLLNPRRLIKQGSYGR